MEEMTPSDVTAYNTFVKTSLVEKSALMWLLGMWLKGPTPLRSLTRLVTERGGLSTEVDLEMCLHQLRDEFRDDHLTWEHRQISRGRMAGIMGLAPTMRLLGLLVPVKHAKKGQAAECEAPRQKRRRAAGPDGREKLVQNGRDGPDVDAVEDVQPVDPVDGFEARVPVIEVSDDWEIGSFETCGTRHRASAGAIWAVCGSGG